VASFIIGMIGWFFILLKSLQVKPARSTPKALLRQCSLPSTPIRWIVTIETDNLPRRLLLRLLDGKLA
jgi:hypothetical protein